MATKLILMRRLRAVVVGRRIGRGDEDLRRDGGPR